MPLALVRVFAVVFVLLSASPFTASFSTCDLKHTRTADEGALGAVTATKVIGHDGASMIASAPVLIPVLESAIDRTVPPDARTVRYATVPTVLRL